VIREYESFDSRLYVLTESSTLRQTAEKINANPAQIVLIVDVSGRLVNTVTDGDVRRALLDGVTLDDTLEKMQQIRKKGNPVTASAEQTDMDIHVLMQKHQIRQVPLVGESGRLVGLCYQAQDLDAVPLRAVVMAGGFGKRLHPLTESTPKPMLPVGGRPLLERILGQLHDAGIHRVNIATHHLADSIMDYFGDGKKLGLQIDYMHELEPQGTGGALRMIDGVEEPVLVINGDILTNLDFRSMFEFHRKKQALLTVAVRRYDMNIPYGVVESEDGLITGLSEKPVYSFFVNAGIYLVEPFLIRKLPSGGQIQMTDIIQHLIDVKKPVASFPIHEYWIDIGSVKDYERANQEIMANENR